MPTATTSATDSCQTTANTFRRIADALDAHAGQPGQIASGYIRIQIGQNLDRAQRIAAVDAIASAAGMPAGGFRQMGDGSWHYSADEEDGLLDIAVYTGHANAA
ncbi:hypothetical protein GCM10010124_26440 [Pilimelia terevasa]|uniref:Uncharacterized protein n=1 Tax=Pilimelia terevasa TaxID=53372 RepID=A0A8J3BM55_9ACTN|nr:hypothetical protein [Pilimelia terevasa]GGK32374.1 hypothetical protein GCM10010124_26440 [Pilimelia terevasa]